MKRAMLWRNSTHYRLVVDTLELWYGGENGASHSWSLRMLFQTPEYIDQISAGPRTRAQESVDVAEHIHVSGP